MITQGTGKEWVMLTRMNSSVLFAVIVAAHLNLSDICKPDFQILPVRNVDNW